VRGAGIDLAKRQDEVAYRVVSLFLDAEQASRSLGAAQNQAESLTRAKELIDARVAEGRALPITSKQQSVEVIRAQQRVQLLRDNLLDAEASLAGVLGMGPEDRVQPAQEERAPLAVPASQEEMIEHAIANSPDVKRLESDMQSKTLEAKGYRAMRYPKVNLVAQYALLGRYNNYSEYFLRFQRNNAELGASFEVPLLAGNSSKAYAAQADTEIIKLRAEVARTRNRIAGDIRTAYEEMKRAEGSRDLARAELDVARDQLDLDLAQMDEGRILLSEVEQARAIENDKWVAYYEAQTGAERARLNVLRQSGALLTALK